MVDQSGDGTTFDFTGGFGSASFTVAEITGAGTALHRIAQLLDLLADRLRSEWLWLGEATTGAAVQPHGSLAAMRDAWWQCLGLQGGIMALAAQATQAAANYADTEVRTMNAVGRAGRMKALGDGLGAWRWGPLFPLKLGADLVGWLNTAKRDGLRDAVEQILNQGGAYAAGAMGPGVAMMYLLSEPGRRDAGADGIRTAFVLRKFFDATGLARPGHLAVRQVPAAEWEPSIAPYHQPGQAIPSGGQPWTIEAGIRGVLSGSNDAYKYPPGSIGVVRIVRPDGTNVWVVHLPGTEDWSTVDSSNPFDMEGNMEGLTAARQQEFKQHEVVVQQLIREALKASGALPGEDVLLTGHSGGGIQAATAAANPAFLADVNVKMIVIAGSPAKNSGVGDDIPVIDLQNENDIVTAADYGPPAPSRNWVTATSHRPPMAEGGGLGASLGEAHSLENYLGDAAALDQSEEPSVAASGRALRSLLGVGAAGVAVGGTKWVYQGRDVDDKPAVNKPASGKATDNKPANARDRPRPGAR
ncbi:hypothetical protein AAGW05_08580 [Arthrobacter sp. LAPM80]|uniref:hypothetical protein n=1 Tax=Arthrobacter sp. LAPM80 TaxID=3141788 RepID=UPI00398B68D1